MLRRCLVAGFVVFSLGLGAAGPAGLAAARAGSCPPAPRPDAVRTLAHRWLAPGVAADQIAYPSLRGRPNSIGWLVRTDLRTPGLSVNLLARQVNGSTQLADLARAQPGTVAAVNGDFFTFGGIGAALGPEIAHRALRKATQSPAPAFAVAGTQARLAEVSVTGTISAPHLVLPISAVNTEQPRPSGVAVFTGLWSGRTTGRPGSLWLQVQAGRLVAATTSPAVVPRGGLVLVADGATGRALARLPRGTAIAATWGQQTSGGPVEAAIGVGTVLRRGGAAQSLGCSIANEAPRPRTALGTSANHHQLLFLVMQGAPIYNHSRAPGVGVRATEAIMAWAGAADAAMLDGGGSAQITAGRAGASLTASEDGTFRPVPNALVVFTQQR